LLYENGLARLPLEVAILLPSNPVATFGNRTRELGDNAEEGALTPSYLVDAEQVIELLHTALASEHTSWMMYTAHAASIHSLRDEVLVREFRHHAEQELEHFHRLLARVGVLGGQVDLAPCTLEKRSIHTYEGPASIEEMVQTHLCAERRAVEFYREAVQWLGDRDPTTRRLLEDVLAVEEQHAHDLQHLGPLSSDDESQTSA
jgi:bacterioferritin